MNASLSRTIPRIRHFGIAMGEGPVALFAMDGKEMRNVPAMRSDDWVRWISQLRKYDPKTEQGTRESIDLEFERAAQRALEGKDSTIYSSAIPGKIWRNTPYEPIYEVLQNENLSRLFFGLFVWDVAVHRKDDCVSQAQRYEAHLRGK
jgi:hypothetical protein